MNLAGLDRHSTTCLIGLWILLFGIYVASPIKQVGDSKYTLLASEHLLHSGNLRLDEHFWPAVDTSDYPSWREKTNNPRHIRKYGDHLYYLYPPGMPVLSAPFVALFKWVTGKSIQTADGRYDIRLERRWQNWSAAFLTATACALLFLLTRELLGVVPSAVITLAAGLSTQLWSIASRCLRTHTWEALLLSASLLLLLRAETRQQSGRPALLATLLSWAFFVRPTAGFFILALTVYVFHRRPREGVILALVGGAWASLFAAFCLNEFGTLLPPYYFRGDSILLSNMPIGLAGQMISPSRGLLVFVPLVPFVAWLVARHWKEIQHRSLAIAALASVLMHTVAMSGFNNWWGGHTYGPRFFTELVPIFVLLGGLGFQAALRRRGEDKGVPFGRVATAAFATCLLAGALFNGAGAISVGGRMWNQHPLPIAQDPMRAFAWKNSQFLCALFPGQCRRGPPSDVIMEP